jgi:NADH-quinone oxidoreductase subunit N
VRDFAGLWTSRPGMAALMTIFLMSLGGIPLTAGFIGKYYIFSAAIQQGYYTLAIIGVLTSVIAVFFYLRIVVMMYMTEGAEPVRPPVPPPPRRASRWRPSRSSTWASCPRRCCSGASSLASILTVF